jgi:dihydrofolate reductase
LAKLIYNAIASLDGYVEDESGGFAWAAPDQEVHAFVNELEREFWETEPSGDDEPEVMRDFAAIWRAADKVVYSRTLDTVTAARTRIERDFDPEAVRRLKADATSDISVGGAELAAQAFRAGLVDECHLFLVPILVGGGKRALPDGVRLELELLDERRFANGTVFLRYATSP